MDSRLLFWTDNRIEQLKSLHADGLTARRIADEMGCFGNCPDGGRCAVIGKLRRLKLTQPEGKQRTLEGAADRAVRPRHPKPAPIVAPPIVPDIPDGEVYGPGIQIRHLTEFNCHYPSGDPREPGFEFCGAPAVKGLPYCARHARLVYQPE